MATSGVENLCPPSSAEAHSIAKSLLNTNLKEGDEWYAVSKKWYTHFQHFAYLNEEKIDDDINREIPPSMNNSDLKHSNNTFELKKELNENQHFVWIYNDLYLQFIEWFGIDDGSLSFKREVINIGNEIKNELIIETYPIFICFVLCDDDGEPDINTKQIKQISRHQNINQFITKITKITKKIHSDNDDNDNDDKLVRIWKKEKKKKNSKNIEGDEFEEIELNEIEGGGIEDNRNWDPFPENEDNINNIEPPSYEEVIDNEYEWNLLNDTDCNIAFGEWAINIDLSSSINYMIEIRDKNGKWKRKYDANKWRLSLSVGTKIDIFDNQYNKWYTGEIIEIGENEKIDQVKIHYDGYSSNYDEYIDINSSRIEILNTHTVCDPFWSSINYTNYTQNSSINYDDTTLPSNDGCVGLRNLGNTCFMNSTIQCLCHCPLFVNYFLNDLYLTDININNPLGFKGKVAEQWSQLLLKYWSAKYSVLSPSLLKTTIAEIQPRFSGYQQHDSSELLQFLLDGLHEDLNRILNKPYTEKIELANNCKICEEEINDIAQKSWNIHKMRNDSIIVDLIQGQIKSRVQCPDCNRISITFDPFMFLSVPLPTEKKQVIKILTVIHIDLNILPKKYAIKLPALSSISDLKDELEKKTKIPKNRLIIADVWSHHIYNIYKNYTSIDQISDSSNNNHTICYEIPTDKQCKELLFNHDNDNDHNHNIKFKIIPIYHQIQKQSTYFNSNHITNQDIGIPLLIKLPLEYDIETSFITQYITKLIKPYCQNFDKWDPSKSNNIIHDDNNNNNAKSLDSDDSDDNTTKQLFDFSDDDEQKEGEQEEEEEEKEEEEEELNSIPYEFVVLDKYGKSCGECSYSSYCNGCNLNNLKDSKIKIPDSTYDTRSIGIRWSFGGQNCFNHNAFLSPLHDESVALNNNESYGSYSSYSSYNTTPQKTINLSKCIDEFVAEETLSKNDAWFCRDCKDHKCATKKLDLYTLPSICIIHLKRFTQNGYYREKNDAPVKYPINGLNLSQWVVNEVNSNDNEILYDLFAVSIHSGGLGGGHYITYAKNLDNKKWYEFDDSSVTQINDENDVYTSSAYLLFYNKRNIQKQSIKQTKQLIQQQTNKVLIKDKTD